METFPLVPDFVFKQKTDFNTVVSEFENGTEQRRAKWSSDLKTFECEFDNRPKSDFTTLQAFFEARQGKYEAFEFTNPLDDVTYTVRFDTDTLQVDHKTALIYSFGCKLKEVR